MESTATQLTLLSISFNDLIKQLNKKEEKIAVIRQQYLQQNYLPNVFQYLKDEGYSYIMIDRIGDIHYFYQLIQPFTQINSIMVNEDIEGFAFNSLTLKDNIDISPSLYTEKYSWTDVTENIIQNYFLLIGNNNYNDFGVISFNKKHKLGELYSTPNVKTILTKI